MTKENQNPAIVVRPSDERGHADHGWLKTHHTFSFGDYHDPAHMGFRSLRVINEDYVGGGQGFGKHPHKNMEILTYILAGALEHQDSMGNASVIKAGDVQKMSAGTGVFHSEFNPSPSETVHLLQIWILPDTQGLAPSYQQFSLAPNKEPLLLIGSPKGGEQVVQFHQDVYLYRGVLKKGERHSFNLNPGRGVWIQMIKGALEANGHALNAGDGASVQNEGEIVFVSSGNSEFLLFDLR
jgi:redox-sensitive bicupin YhaK (pirin superfamily)